MLNHIGGLPVWFSHSIRNAGKYGVREKKREEEGGRKKNGPRGRWWGGHWRAIEALEW